MNAERLGAIDATYLAAEESRVPLHVASLAIFEAGPLLDERGVFRLDEVRARIDGRLGLLPRLRQRVADVPFGIARPVWVDDVDFDIVNHVDVVGLPSPHDEAALLQLAAELVMTPLDRARPLWHLRFVTGLEGDRVALIERAHHAMVDGVSGVDVSVVLLDASPDSPANVDTGWEPAPAPGAVALLVGGVIDRVRAPWVSGARTVVSLANPARAARNAREVVAALRTVGASGARAPRSSINMQVGSRRRIVVLRERLSDVRSAGHARGATVNDVVLTAVAGGMRALFLSRGESLPPDRTVKVLIPVSLRDESESMTLGNRVGGLLASLPIGIGDIDERLEAIAKTTKELKASPEASAADVLLRVADLLPPSIAKTIGRGVHHQPFVNTVVTNVPGPPFPLYAMGARMLEAFPIVPLGGNMDLEVAVLSYDGALTLGITADCATCPDVEVFADGLERSLCDLGARWSPAVVEAT